MAEEMSLPPGHLEIHDNVYKTVALRVSEFWEDHDPARWGIRTTLIEASEERVLFKAEVIDGKRIVGTGHAEETRLGMINATSALENCETSAIGRALASIGYGGSVMEYASADEMRRAIQKQDVLEEGKLSPQKVKAYAEGFREAVANNDTVGGLQLWEELTQPQMLYLWQQMRSYERTATKKLIEAAKAERDKLEPMKQDKQDA